VINASQEQPKRRGNYKHLWQPGQSGNPKGKPKGTKHSQTIAVERAIHNTFNDLQGIPDKSLTSWAIDNTTAFYTILYPKIIPRNIDITSSDGAFPALITAALMEIAARYQAGAGGSEMAQGAIDVEFEEIPQLEGPGQEMGRQDEEK
jgi:hypothetical protein